jgi:hypothetical protein
MTNTVSVLAPNGSVPVNVTSTAPTAFNWPESCVPFTVTPEFPRMLTCQASASPSGSVNRVPPSVASSVKLSPTCTSVSARGFMACGAPFGATKILKNVKAVPPLASRAVIDTVIGAVVCGRPTTRVPLTCKPFAAGWNVMS